MKLKYVVLQTKDLYVMEQEGAQEKDITLDSESSETSTSDSDVREEIKEEWRKTRETEVEMIKGWYWFYIATPCH